MLGMSLSEIKRTDRTSRNLSKTYHHGPYYGFYIHDPKQRHIHKATVRDRILHHAVFSMLNPLFEETFILTSFSCRIGFGTHKGVDALAQMIRKVSKNGSTPTYVLKCDIKKFFDSVDHEILLDILNRRIEDENVMWLLREIVKSYVVNRERERERVQGRIQKPVFQSAI
jgi:RNA-directed DNA polymerase